MGSSVSLFGPEIPARRKIQLAWRGCEPETEQEREYVAMMVASEVNAERRDLIRWEVQQKSPRPEPGAVTRTDPTRR